MTTRPLGAYYNAILFFLIFFLPTQVMSQDTYLKKESGIINATAWDFNSQRLPLTGYWNVYQNRLLDPSAIEKEDEKSKFAYFPKLFNDNNKKGFGLGYATYKLIVVVPHDIRRYSVEIPQLYNSYKLWINGEPISTTGKVGTNEAETIPQWRSQKVSFNTTRDTLDIVLQISNFHHHKGGAKDPIYLGTPERIDHHWAWAYGTNMVEIIFLFLEAVVFVLIFLNQKNKKVILYFACLCFTWSLRGAFSNLYPVVSIWPDFNWNLLVKIQYLTLFGGSIWAILFLSHLFKGIGNQIIAYLLVGINVFFALFTLVTPPLIFSRWLSVYLAVASITIIYGGIIVIRALLYDQVGAWFLMVSLLCGAFVFGYDVVAYGSASGYNLVFLHMGYMVIFMLITIALLFHLGIFKSKSGRSDMLTYNDMFRSDSADEKKKR